MVDAVVTEVRVGTLGHERGVYVDMDHEDAVEVRAVAEDGRQMVLICDPSLYREDLARLIARWLDTVDPAPMPARTGLRLLR